MARKSKKKSSKQKRIEKQLLRVSVRITAVTMLVNRILWRVLLWASLVAFVIWALSWPDWARLAHGFDFQVLLQFVTVLIWPIVVIIGLIILGPDLRDVMRRGFEFAFGGARIKVEPKAQQADATALNEVERTTQNVGDVDTSDATSVADNRTPDEILEEAYHRPDVRYEFEKTYRIIFGTQLEFLFLLNAYPSGLGGDTARVYYDRHVEKRAPSVEYSFLQYMGFLTASSLIGYDPTTDVYTITPVGTLFLRYLNEQNIGNPEAKSL